MGPSSHPFGVLGVPPSSLPFKNMRDQDMRDATMIPTGRRRERSTRGVRVAVCSGLAMAVCVAAIPSYADEATPEPASAPATSRFEDPGDGRFDVSGFLDTAHGFMPLLV